MTGGCLEVAGRTFTTLVATFEPFPSKALLHMMEQLAAGAAGDLVGAASGADR